MSITQGDSLEVLKRIQDNSIDSMVTDPPAGIAFMGKKWDTSDIFHQQMHLIFRECLRVLKPGAHGFVWAIPRTSHWTAAALEEAGFEIRDVISHVFGTGFPKSHNIGKALDRAAGEERDIAHHSHFGDAFICNACGKSAGGSASNCQCDTTGQPITEEAAQWEGWGTALKPASEHWLLVRKPLAESTIAKNVLKYGTGAINIDASRIGSSGARNNGNSNGTVGSNSIGVYGKAIKQDYGMGRFPANFMLSHHEECGNKCHSDCAVAELDRQSGICSPGGWGHVKTTGFGKFGGGKSEPTGKRINGTAGGASRFFYCAKPNKAERDAGCEELEEKEIVQFQTGNGASGKPSSISEGRDTRRRNNHPTVKPTKLMRYLITMITPPGGSVLDPFAGSGTTGVAAIETGREPVLIERETEYVDIAKARLEKASEDNETQYILFSNEEASV